MLNYIILQLLETLLHNQEGVLIATMLKTLGISRRVLYYNLEKLNDFLKSQGFAQIVSEGGKLVLDITQDDAQEIRERIVQNQQAQYVLSSYERQLLIKLYIGIAQDPATIDVLSELLDVSRNTVLGDITELKQSLEEEGLTLESRQRGGYELCGDEAMVRKYVMHCFNFLRQSYIREKACRIVLDALNRSAGGEFSQDIFEEMQALVQSSEQFSTYFFNLKTVMDIACYLLITKIRSAKAAVNIPTGEFWELQLCAARHIMEGMERLGLALPPQELGYVTAILLGSKVSFHSATQEEDSVCAQFEADLTEEFEKVALVKLSHNPDLSNLFILHIRPMYYRLRYHIWVDNSQKESIIQKLYSFYVLTGLAVKEVERKYGFSIPDDEVAYLSVYFGSFIRDHIHKNDIDDPHKRKMLIVCGTGICTSLLVKQQLMNMLGSTCVYETIDERATTPQLLDQYDLVVSTVDLPYAGSHFIKVSPVITSLQREKLLKWSLSGKMRKNDGVQLNDILNIVEQSAEIKNRDELINGLLSYFDSGFQKPVELHLQDVFLPAFIRYIKDEALSPQRAMQMSCAPLAHAGLIDMQYAQSILDTIDDLGLYAEYHEGILLAHAKPGEETHGIGIGITVFEHPVHFPKWKRDIKVFVILSTVDNFTHVYALQELLNILAGKERRDLICSYRGEDPDLLFEQLISGING